LKKYKGLKAPFRETRKVEVPLKPVYNQIQIFPFGEMSAGQWGLRMSENRTVEIPLRP
jgi:hypothetical protein